MAPGWASPPFGGSFVQIPCHSLPWNSDKALGYILEVSTSPEGFPSDTEESYLPTLLSNSSAIELSCVILSGFSFPINQLRKESSRAIFPRKYHVFYIESITVMVKGGDPELYSVEWIYS